MPLKPNRVDVPANSEEHQCSRRRSCHPTVDFEVQDEIFASGINSDHPLLEKHFDDIHSPTTHVISPTTVSIDATKSATKEFIFHAPVL